MSKKKPFGNRFLDSKQAFKPEHIETHLGRLSSAESAANRRKDNGKIVAAKIRLMAELIRHFGIDCSELSPAGLYEKLTLRLMMHQRGIDWCKEGAELQLYEAVIDETVPAAEIDFVWPKINFSHVKILVMVGLVKETLSNDSTNSACEHLIKKYPGEFPKRLRESYQEIKRDGDPNVLLVAESMLAMAKSVGATEEAVHEQLADLE